MAARGGARLHLQFTKMSCEDIFRKKNNEFNIGSRIFEESRKNDVNNLENINGLPTEISTIRDSNQSQTLMINKANPI